MVDMARCWPRLDISLLFDAAWCAGVRGFLALLLADRRLHRDLLEALHEQRHLALREEDGKLLFAEALARLRSLEVLTIGSRSFVLSELRFEQAPDLAGDVPLTAAQAAVLAPVLRNNHGLQRVRCADSWLHVHHLTNTWAREGALFWSSIASDAHARARSLQLTPSCDADCVLVAGLIARPSPCAGLSAEPRLLQGLWRCTLCRRVKPQTIRWTLELGLHGLDTLSGVALAAAETRVGGRFVKAGSFGYSNAHSMFEVSRPPPKKRRGSQLFRWLPVLLLALAALSLRLQENAYAIETGYGGALMPHHPLRMYDVHERHALGLLLTDADTAAKIGSCTVTNADPHRSFADSGSGDRHGINADDISLN